MTCIMSSLSQRPMLVRMQGEALLVVELAALLHDVGDWKYSEAEASAPTVKATPVSPTATSLCSNALHSLLPITQTAINPVWPFNSISQ